MTSSCQILTFLWVFQVFLTDALILIKPPESPSWQFCARQIYLTVPGLCLFSHCIKCRSTQQATTISPTIFDFPDFSLTNVKLADFFSMWSHCRWLYYQPTRRVRAQWSKEGTGCFSYAIHQNEKANFLYTRLAPDLKISNLARARTGRI